MVRRAKLYTFNRMILSRDFAVLTPCKLQFEITMPMCPQTLVAVGGAIHCQRHADGAPLCIRCKRTHSRMQVHHNRCRCMLFAHACKYLHKSSMQAMPAMQTVLGFASFRRLRCVGAYATKTLGGPACHASNEKAD